MCENICEPKNDGRILIIKHEKIRLIIDRQFVRKETVCSICGTFLNRTKMKHSGYLPGIYCNH